ncbi:serine hydrolase domain-containing protein [Anaerolinea thermophila]|uniref:Hydrolase n=1 Tax=Anaerolinea thermophila (strain DSM 14523 / JCM 11388 / NBRC 100420 / UNI-1) TaxID=926569 RepID=E8N2U8_ANATU|nr:serine hydrolase domain-containing protein [Anaerolinea thermophila]BAJ65098.1 putative hydrolase [Anaerolinea thermophila UNI-1]
MERIPPEQAGFSSVRLQRITSFFQSLVDRQVIAGVDALVARRGRVAYRQCVGFADLESAKPLAEDALYRIYSMSKPITSVAVMMLFEEGAFHLFDPVARYIPALGEVKVYQPRSGGADFDLVPPKRPITIHDLLTHTAGLSYGFDEHSYIDDLYRKMVWQRLEKDPEITLGTLVEEIAKIPLAFHPGTSYRYSTAIDVLGYLVEVVSGKPFDVFLRERIFEPLGMNDTDFWAPPEKAARLANLYGPAEGGGLKVIQTMENFLRKPSVPSGGGGLVSSTADYFRFAQMMLNRGEWQGVRLLGRRTVEWMWMNHLPEGLRLPDDPACGFGLGGSVVVDAARHWHMCSPGNWGWGGAANTWFFLDPSEDLLAMIMLQYMPGFTIPFHHTFANLVYQALND